MQARKPSFAIALSLIVALSIIVYIQQAHGAPMQKTWVLIVRECDDTSRAFVLSSLQFPSVYGYDEYWTSNYEVVSMGGVDMLTLHTVTVPLLRSVFPSDYFLFLFDVADKDAYKKALLEKTGGAAYGEDGYAFVKERYALSVWDNPEFVKHEFTHLATCRHHNNVTDPVEKWYLVGC